MYRRDQADSLRQRLSRTHKEQFAKTISIVSGKGGVGKSNTALNFSISLQEKGKKVLLFDLDVGMGNIDILLGIDTKYTIIDMFNNTLSIHDIIERGPKGLSYIAGGTGLTEFFTMNQDKIDYFYNQYNQLVSNYDYILFDLGAGATDDSMNFVLASDECIVVTTPEPTAITDAYSMIKFIVKREREMPISVIMNRCLKERDGLQALSRFEKVVKQFLGVEVKKIGILPDDKIVTTAVIKQTPYLLLDRKSPVSKAIEDIVINYLSYSEQINTIRSFSFINKLKQLMTVRF